MSSSWRARTREGASPVNLALAGAAIDAGLGALIFGLLSVDAATFDQFRFWVVGALGGRTPQMAMQVAPFITVGLLLALVAARGLDALSLGDDVAKGLGHRVGPGPGRRGHGAAVLLTGAAVAVAGPIAFVGLAVPHAARKLAATSAHRWVLPLSALLGAALCWARMCLGGFCSRRVRCRPG